MKPFDLAYYSLLTRMNRILNEYNYEGLIENKNSYTLESGVQIKKLDSGDGKDEAISDQGVF